MTITDKRYHVKNGSTGSYYHYYPGTSNSVGLESSTATAGGATTLSDGVKFWQTNYWAGFTVVITGGTGSGQSRTVASNTGITLTVTSAWGTNPDGTSTYTIKPTVPSWITISDNTTDNIITFTFTSPTTGEYGAYDFKAFSLYITVVAAQYIEIPSCCTGNLNIAWLNRLGGWQNWNFLKKRTFTVDVGTGTTFETSDNIMYYSGIAGVYEGEEVVADVFSKDWYDVLATLKYSIQAFAYNEDTLAFDIPIILDLESFSKYSNNGGNKITFSFKFRYAEKLLVQIQ